MKEPNGVLVMTTCKCRENNENLVMTRAYFDDIIKLKVEQGVRQERERVLNMLQDFFELGLLDESEPNPEWDRGFQAAMAVIRSNK
jgi:hypothetical protein